MHQRIEHRSPSLIQRCALTNAHGAAFMNPKAPTLAQDFIPAEEVREFFGTPDSWVAHKLLSVFARCVGMVEEEG